MIQPHMLGGLAATLLADLLCESEWECARWLVLAAGVFELRLEMHFLDFDAAELPRLASFSSVEGECAELIVDARFADFFDQDYSSNDEGENRLPIS